LVSGDCRMPFQIAIVARCFADNSAAKCNVCHVCVILSVV
jgi:hypothetical protein